MLFVGACCVRVVVRCVSFVVCCLLFGAWALLVCELFVVLVLGMVYDVLFVVCCLMCVVR